MEEDLKKDMSSIYIHIYICIFMYVYLSESLCSTPESNTTL